MATAYPIEDTVPATSLFKGQSRQRLMDRLRDGSRFVGPVLALAMLTWTIVSVSGGSLNELDKSIPKGWAFWMLLVVFLAIEPLFDFAIYRRLWRLPANGLITLFRKTATNELLMGYLGEVQFYAWARKHARLEGSPFGAIKDVAVLSAIAGNIVTLILLVLIWPRLSQVIPASAAKPIAGSVIFLLGTSVLITLFRNRILSIGGKLVSFVLTMHLSRSVLTLVVLALLWHSIDPTIGAAAWLMMAAGRQLVTRLPFVPNKDLAFSSIVLLSATATGSAVAMTGALIFAGQVTIGCSLAAIELARALRSGRQEAR